MIRIVAWIVGLAIPVATAVWLADRPGSVALVWEGWRVDTSVAILLLCVGLVAIGFAIACRLWLALRAAPGRYRLHRRAARRQDGYRALARGMAAVAAGDAEEARRQARRAERLIDERPLTLPLSAQAARLEGDTRAARGYFEAMLERPETAVLALRGLLGLARRDGDETAALDYVRRAHALRPKTPWVLRELFDLEVRGGRWRDALATLDQAVRHRAIDAAEGERRRAVVCLGCSGEAGAAGDARGALRFARRAQRIAPDLLPATLRIAGLLIGNGRMRAAAKVIRGAWARGPHPELARLYVSTGGGEDAIATLGRVEKLAALDPEHVESRVAVAEAALAARMWGTARKHLEQAASAAPSARLCRLMADLEQAERGDAEAARGWLSRAASATPDAAWVCEGCHAADAHWGPFCPGCDALGAMRWTIPDRAPERPPMIETGDAAAVVDGADERR